MACNHYLTEVPLDLHKYIETLINKYMQVDYRGTRVSSNSNVHNQGEAVGADCQTHLYI